MSEFDGLINGIRAVGRSGGYSILRIVVLVDERGTPLLYPSIDCKRLSPRLPAKERLDEIIKSLVDDSSAGWESVQPGTNS